MLRSWGKTDTECTVWAALHTNTTAGFKPVPLLQPRTTPQLSSNTAGGVVLAADDSTLSFLHFMGVLSFMGLLKCDWECNLSYTVHLSLDLFVQWSWFENHQDQAQEILFNQINHSINNAFLNTMHLQWIWFVLVLVWQIL